MFATHGARWEGGEGGTPTAPIYWEVEGLDRLDFDRGSFSVADFERETAEAFQAWEDVSGIDFEPATNANPADVTVTTASIAGPAVGSARWNFFPSSQGFDEIVSAEVTIDSDVFWSPEGGAGGVDYFAVTTHEIGHAIGFEHVDDPAQIMNAVVSVDELGDGDIAGAVSLYGEAGAAPPVTPPDLPEEPAPEADGGDDGGGGAGAILGLVALAGLAALAVGLAGGAGVAVAMMAGGGAMLLGGGGSGGGAAAAEVPDAPDDAETAAAAEDDIPMVGGCDHDHDHGHDHAHGTAAAEDDGDILGLQAAAEDEDILGLGGADAAADGAVLLAGLPEIEACMGCGSTGCGGCERDPDDATLDTEVLAA